MRKLILSLAVLAGVAGTATAADAGALREPFAAPQVQTVQYYEGGRYGGRPDWRHREWRRREAYERHRRHEWRREQAYRGGYGHRGRW